MASEWYLKVSGAWKQVNEAFYKSSGSWKEISRSMDQGRWSRGNNSIQPLSQLLLPHKHPIHPVTVPTGANAIHVQAAVGGGASGVIRC